MYLALKHSHMLLAFLSVTLFVVRFIWLQRGSVMLSRRWVKITPHVIDTLLLLSALGILVLIPWYGQAWLWQKLLLVLIYIGLGFITLKLAKSRLLQWLGFTLALLSIAAIVWMARTKIPLLWS